jgi:hypothetical protein
MILSGGLDHLPGVDGPNAPDHPGAENFSRSPRSNWSRGLEEPRPKLLAIAAIVDPLIHSPDAVIYSPAEMLTAWPTTVIPHVPQCR